MSVPRGVGRPVKEKSGQMKITRLLLAILLVNLCVVGNVIGATPADEAQALETVLKTLQYTFYSAATPPCTFFKPEVVTCDPASGLITKLNLSSMGLRGKLPPQIGTFKSLELLDLTTYNSSLGFPNQIVGPLPDELGNLAQLKYFNVTGNCFTNSTKESDSCKRDLRCDQISRKYNDNGCAPCPSQQYMYDFIKCLCAPLDVKFGEGKKSFAIGAIVGIVAAFVALLLAIFALWRYKPSVFRDPFKKKDIDYGPWEIPSGVQKYSLAELAKATNNWSESNEIGQGGFGKVFHGVFEDGKMVAIKRASDSSTQGTSEFRNEVVLLSRLHHRHLVRLEGFCDDRGLQILVYEFMENGNLHDLLTGVKKGRDVPWYKRLEIAVGVAQGLDYLHTMADPPVIHRDIKPSNILLDSELVAKVADFGISKEKENIETHISTRPAGTAGYLDPEYFLRRHLTTASDVYAYGVCLLELITGQQSIDHMRLEEFNLIEWVKPRFKTGGVDAIVDTALGEDYDREVMKEMTEVALACSAFSKKDRITMKEVLNILGPRLANASALNAASISEKVKRLSTRDDPNTKLYNKHKEGSTSDLKVPLPDHTSTSSPATTTQFDLQILSPR
uniref:Protein kinase domain-containing protein n=1 Tax=Physcomitrium patens TaxID=3218 RepID=A0A7I4AHJ9_PHYPA